MTESAYQTTLLASIRVMMLQARAYFGVVPPEKGEGVFLNVGFGLVLLPPLEVALAPLVMGDCRVG